MFSQVRAMLHAPYSALHAYPPLLLTFNFSPATCLSSALAVLDLEDGYLDVRDPGKTGERRARWDIDAS